MKLQKPYSELHETVHKDYNTINFLVKQNSAPPTYHMHWHEEIEIQYIIEGTNIAWCGNEIIEAQKDSFYIINSAEVHQSIGGNRRHACIQFSPLLLGKNNIVLKRLVKDPYLSEIMSKMLEEYYKNDEFVQINIQSYAHLIITHLYRNHAYKSLSEREMHTYSERQLILNKCIKYIHNNYNKEIKLDDITAMANVSKYYFCNIFKEFTGQTFKEYQNHIRVTKAIELLAATDLTITEIAFLCGFNDSNYFSRKFRQITGKTPVATRKELKNTIDLN